MKVMAAVLAFSDDPRSLHASPMLGNTLGRPAASGWEGRCMWSPKSQGAPLLTRGPLLPDVGFWVACGVSLEVTLR